jgi:hypothetical protein
MLITNCTSPRWSSRAASASVAASRVIAQPERSRQVSRVGVDREPEQQ